MTTAALLFLAGLVGGVLLSIPTRFGRFCSLGAVEDLLYGGRYYRALMWPASMGWSMVFVGLAIIGGWLPIDDVSILGRVPNIGAHIIGGLMFGLGMALTGMCGYTALARVGTGDMRALVVVIFIGIGAMAITAGVLSPLRIFAFPYESSHEASSFAIWINREWGLAVEWVFLCIGAILIALPMLRANFRNSKTWLWPILIGFTIAFGFVSTALIREIQLESTPIVSHTFSAPIGYSLLYIMQSMIQPLNFGIGSALGVVLGSIAASLIKKEFRWEACDDARELSRHMIGALLMGAGAVIALGCSIGQGLSAMAVLYMGAPIAIISIIIGAYLGLKYLIEG